MSRRRRGGVERELTALAMLGVLTIVFLPQLRAVGIAVGSVVVGVAAGVALYRVNSSKVTQPFGRTNCSQAAVPLRARAIIHDGESQQLRPSSDVDTAPYLCEGELLRTLQMLDWFQFEKLMAAVFEALGGKVTRRGGANPDGGIDLVVINGNETIAVQCKHWKKWKIKEPTVREFLGAMTHEGIQRGIVLTLCGYTAEAKRLGEAHNIQILAEDGLLSLLASAKVANGPKLWAALMDRRKICPKCEAEMVERVATKGLGQGDRFWGCSRYPRCRYTMPMERE